MTTHGLLVRNADGQVTFDSRQVVGGCLVDVVQGSSGASVVRSYPAYPGRSARVLELDGLAPTGVTVDTDLGYPRITIGPTGGPIPFFGVWVL